LTEVTATLRTVKESFITRVAETGLGNSYMSVHEADEILDENPDEAPLEVLQEAYRVHVLEARGRLNGTLFRFLLSRLGKQRDSFAAQHCLSLLEPFPEETDYILKYFRSIGPGAEIEARIVDWMRSSEMVYPYQSYGIIEWFYESSTDPSTALIDLVRYIGFDPLSPRYLKTICRAFLGKFGASADIERIALEYDETNDASERTEIICSIRRMEPARRNAFLARAQQDGGENVRAVRWVRGGQ
jgi:hypothetical protein